MEVHFNNLYTDVIKERWELVDWLGIRKFKNYLKRSFGILKNKIYSG